MNSACMEPEPEPESNPLLCTAPCLFFALIDLVIAPLMLFRLLPSASFAALAAMHVAERCDTYAHLSSRHQHIDFSQNY